MLFYLNEHTLTSHDVVVGGAGGGEGNLLFFKYKNKGMGIMKASPMHVTEYLILNGL